MRTTKDIIKELCSERGMTVQQLEQALGFGNGTIGKWDKSEPNAVRLEKVSEYLNVTTEYLRGKTMFNRNYQLFAGDGDTSAELTEGDRLLFSALRGATEAEKIQAAKIIEALRK